MQPLQSPLPPPSHTTPSSQIVGGDKVVKGAGHGCCTGVCHKAGMSRSAQTTAKTKACTCSLLWQARRQESERQEREYKYRARQR